MAKKHTCRFYEEKKKGLPGNINQPGTNKEFSLMKCFRISQELFAMPYEALTKMRTSVKGETSKSKSEGLSCSCKY